MSEQWKLQNNFPWAISTVSGRPIGECYGSSNDGAEAKKNAAHIVRCVNQHESLIAEIQHWQARYEAQSKLLTDILLHLPAPPVKLDDGRVMEFVDPDPARTLRMLQLAIKRALDAHHAR